MKKIILTVAAIFVLSFANAQDNEGIKFGVKGGWSHSKFSGDGNPEQISGYYFGGLIDYSLLEKLHIQPEVLYSAEGAKDAKLNYLRVPIMVKLYLTEGLNVQAGPEAGFLIGGDSDVKDNVKSFDYGLGFGAAYEFSGLFIDARFNYGLANINKEGDFKNGTATLNFGLGYRF